MRNDRARFRRGARAARLALTGAAMLAALALAACQTSEGEANAVENTLEIVGAASAIDPNAVVEASPGTSGSDASPQAFAGNAARVHLAPIVGAPVEQVSVLSRRLSAAAPQRNIRLERSASAGIDHEIRGYFSALSENGQTTVIHVWDVFTPSGQRVHRIQGQERFAGASGDPWDAVPASVMQTIADRMLADYLGWRGRTA